MERVYRIIAVLGVLATIVFGYLAFSDDRVPDSLEDISALLTSIDAKLKSGETSFADEGEVRDVLSQTSAIVETTFARAEDAGLTDLPILRLTERPAPIKMDDTGEFRLSDGSYVAAGISTYNNEPYVTINNKGSYFKPGTRLDANADGSCSILLLNFDEANDQAFVRAVCE